MGLLFGFITGLLGSAHCIGMCGPIALALPGSDLPRNQLLWGRILYNLGRTITYAFLGALAGFLGLSLSAFGSQQTLSIVMGVFIIMIAVLPGRATAKMFPFINKITFPGWMKKVFNQNLKKGTPSALFIIGILNGFLPCGLVYFAIAGAIAMGTIFHGVIYMFLFGLGTSPAMFAVSMVGNLLNVGLRKRFNQIIPVFGFILGVLFILRGLNLGIPFISPTEQKIEHKLEQKVDKKDMSFNEGLRVEYFLIY